MKFHFIRNLFSYMYVLIPFNIHVEFLSRKVGSSTVQQFNLEQLYFTDCNKSLYVQSIDL